MKKFNLLLIISLLGFSMGIFFACGGEKTLDLPSYEIVQVSKYLRDDSITMKMSYNKQGLSAYELLIHGVSKGISNIRYKPGSIICSLNGIDYTIELFNSKGSSRVEKIEARVGKSKLYDVQYWFDDENRLSMAQIGGANGYDKPVFTTYKYEGNTITIWDGQTHHRLTLSANDNLGYVCNVLDFAGENLTSNYVIHPDLYFLNIYGAPIGKLPELPAGQSITYSDDQLKLLSVGKYSYDY